MRRIPRNASNSGKNGALRTTRCCLAASHVGIPFKDHPNLLQALSALAGSGGAVRCVLVGGGLTTRNAGLMGLLAQYNLESSVVLAGPRSDIPSVTNAMDFHLLPSASEAFPNVVAEAKACGIPWVVTNVGDAAVIVGDTGWVVPPKNPVLLPRAIEEAKDSLGGENDAKRRIDARQRIEDNFGLEKNGTGLSPSLTTGALK